MMSRVHTVAAALAAWLGAALGTPTRRAGMLAACCWMALMTARLDGAPLVSLDYRIGGTRLAVSPASLSVPKNIAGSVLVEVSGIATNDPSLANTYVEAVLRGPSFPARRVVGAVNSALLLPPLPLVGDYQLDGVRLVDATSGTTRLEGSPSSVPVKVFDEVLVSRVTSRALSLDEIRERGITVDEKNFRTVEFEVGFVLEGRTIPVRLPVVAPTFQQSSEIIPAAELQARLTEAAAINGQIASTTELPRELETRGLNIQVQGINFQRVEGGEDTDLALRIPPIPAVMVIPGNIGFLNQFFSVQIFTENGAPGGSALVAKNIRAELRLPAGPDRIPAASYDAPGDDPLRFARLGPGKTVQPVQSVVRPGADGKPGTADDITRLNPGESGQGEFLVEGLQEGLHVMDIDLTADLDGLAAGTVRIQGRASGSVLVRNPKFSLSFSHPRTIRAGEPYVASVTVFNSSAAPANLVRVSLRQASISGGVLESAETVELGTIGPGEAATANYRVRAQRTGAIAFSNLTTGDDATAGQFRLTMGIDERGVALSPDAVAMPDFVGRLPAKLVAAATRVIGQALSAATAAQLPAGVLRVPRSVVTRRVIELAEAGQRLRYGDPLGRVLPDLLRDWQGGRAPDAGFDQILRATDAGREWREALFQAMEEGDALTGVGRLTDRAADLAGLGQAVAVGASDSGELMLEFGSGLGATARTSTATNSLVYPGTRGAWAVTPMPSDGSVVWRFTNAPPEAGIAVALVSTNGTTRLWRWTIESPPLSAVYRFALGRPEMGLSVDLDGDGAAEESLPGTVTDVAELPPRLVAVEQDLTIQSGRPAMGSCLPPSYAANYGTVLAVVYSKPMTQGGAGNPASYVLDNGIAANSVKLQPDGRVALLNLRQPISAIRPRSLQVQSVVDLRGTAVTGDSLAVHSVIPGTDTLFREGVAVRGRVIRGDGTPASGIPVTLTYYDQARTPNGECEGYVARVAQVFTDVAGGFTFDYVMAGVPYSVSATDTGSLPPEAVQVLLNSASGDELNRQKLLEQLSAGSSANSLLSAFLSTSLPQAVAVAEGLDRALVRDLVDTGSPRLGQEVPMALQFRGRASVTGQVLASDGATTVAGAAVNLFPDPDSRELGRGVLSDGQGKFAFFGVPLGLFTIDVRSPTSAGRTIAGLVEIPGTTTNLIVVLSTNAVETTSLAGRVYEADNVTPHAGARVIVGRFDPSRNIAVDAVAFVTADTGGNWSAPNIPRRSYDVMAISVDGRRKGVRRSVATVPDQVSFVTVSLEDVTRVLGRVQFDDGRPAPGALVAGGEALVRTDAAGNFELTGVPLGSRTISAGVERNAAAGIDFPRLGSATLNVVGGANNFVLVRLRPAGRIFGKVLDAVGRPVAGARVAIPQENGFLWTDADALGNYAFENLGLGGYTLSAPANQVAPQLDTSALIDTIRTGRENEVLTAFGEAIRTFVGANDPYLNGQQQQFNPVTWGYTTAGIQFDGQGVVADIRLRPAGSVSGRVLNHQGVPIGAKVRLTGLGPTPSGAPGTMIRGEMNSDPESGQFRFEGVLLAGTWALQAASPFYPVVIGASGTTTILDPSVSGITLQFPAAREVNGRLAGAVFQPDGTPAGAGVTVKINFSDDYEIHTDAAGLFDTQLAVPAIDRNGGSINYRVEAVDSPTGRRGVASIGMSPGVTNLVSVRLLARDGVASIRVLRADGTPAALADVRVDQGSFPQEQFEGTTDDQGRVRFVNLFEGTYSVGAQFTESNTRVGARSGFTIAPGTNLEVTLRLSGTGTLAGQFRKSDRITPVPFAQISIGNLGFATTDADGRFRFEGVPPGSYRILASDPVTGATGQSGATLPGPNQTVEVNVFETARGEVGGLVVDSDGVSPVPLANVVLEVFDGLIPARTVTTGPDGRFSFPGTPAGRFRVSARHPSRVLGGQAVAGERSGTLPDGVASIGADILLEPLGILPVLVLEPGGQHPVTNAVVSVFVPFGGGVSAAVTTDDSGRAVFLDLPLRRVATLTAFAPIPPGNRNGVVTNVVLTQVGTNPPVTLLMPGVGRISGVVIASDGATPVAGADVEFRSESALFPGGFQLLTSTDADGRFEFSDLPLGAYRVSAARLGLAGAINARLSTAGQADEWVIRLGDSGSIAGRLLRADGATPVVGLEVLLLYASQSANPGRAVVRSDETGHFEFGNIPTGAFTLRADGPGFGGVVRKLGQLTANGQRVEVGDLPFDEANPSVVGVTPADTAQDVSIRTLIEIAFSEELDPASLTPVGIFVRSGSTMVPGAISLVPDGEGRRRIVRFVPADPLPSQKIYDVVVMSSEVSGPLGSVIGTGPSDLVGRFLPAPFVSRFATRDDDPPQVVSVFPANQAIQVDPRAVPRVVFNEPIRSADAVIRLIGPDFLPVPGQVSASLNGLALSFTPAAALLPNSSYILQISNIVDLAGNRHPAPSVGGTFATLDTLGPGIASLSIVGGRRPVAGTRLFVEATLAVAESGVSYRFTQDFNQVPVVPGAPQRVEVLMPLAGSTTRIRAIATDRFGNDGAVAELAITALANDPPVVSLNRLAPVSGPVASGSGLTLALSATDDDEVVSVTLVSVGAVGLSTNYPSGSARSLVLSIPETAQPDSTFRLIAQATDGVGQRSLEAVLEVTVSDGTSPQVAILSPGQGSLLDPNQPLALSVASSDNGPAHRLQMDLSGALIKQQVIEVASGPGQSSTNTATFDLAEAARDGTSILAVVRAIDPAGNARVTSRSFRLPDRVAPELIAITPTNHASGVEALARIALTFSEPIDTNRMVAGVVKLLRDADAGLVAMSLRFETNDTVVRLAPDAPLSPSTRYRVVATREVTDRAGNPLAAEVVSTFEVGGFSIAAPADGSRLIEGQVALLRGAFTESLGQDAVRFRVGTEVLFARPFDAAVPWSVPLLSTLGGDSLSITAEALLGETVLATARSVVTVLPADGDADGDSVPNGFEAAHGSDPFKADAASDVDSDGLANGAEYQAGTDPQNPDTDGDLIPDGTDPSPLTPNHRPVAGALDAGKGLRFDGADDYARVPFNAASPLFQLGSRLTFEAWVNPTGPGPLISRQQCVFAWPATEFELAGSGGRLSLQLRLNPANNNGAVTFTSAAVLPTNQWSHVAATWDGASRRVRLYVDGQSVLSADYDRGSVWTPNTPFWFGGIPAPSDGCWSSAAPVALDEIRIWNVERTGAEIRASMSERFTEAPPGLVGDWRLNEGTGATAFESSGGGNSLLLGDGTPGRQPAWTDSGAGVFPVAVPTFENTPLAVALPATDVDPGDVVRVSISSLPAHGALYQTTDGITRGPSIDAVPTTVNGSPARVIYVPTGDFIGADRFSYSANDGFVESRFAATVSLNVVKPENLGRVPTIDPVSVELVAGQTSEIGIAARDADANLRRFAVEAVDGQPAWQRLVWTNGGSTTLQLDSEVASATAVLSLRSDHVGSVSFRVSAFDSDGLSADRVVTAVVLSDLDHDGIADRDDPDIDGDGLANDAEIAAGTNPVNFDTDGDGRMDGVDPLPTTANRAPFAAMSTLRPVLPLDASTSSVLSSSGQNQLNPGAGSWTVSAWIQTDATDAVPMTIAGRYECGQGNCSAVDGSAASSWILSLGSDGRLVFGARGDSGVADGVQSTGGPDLRDGALHHVAGVLDRVGSRIQVWVDGQVVGAADANGLGEIWDPVSRFTIGRQFIESFVSTQFRFNGVIRDVRLWASARSNAELLTEEGATPPYLDPALVGYWPLNDGPGAPVRDASGHGLTLGIEGSGSWQPSNAQIGTLDRVVTLGGSDVDGDAVTALVTELPGGGARLFQWDAAKGRGTQITSVPTAVADPARRVVLSLPHGSSGSYFFRYLITDGLIQSSPATVALRADALPGDDFDGDGIPDAFEVANGLDAERNDALEDLDGDGLSNLAEYQGGSDPREEDTDRDGASDGIELARGSNPKVPDTDDDGLPDGADPEPLVRVDGLVIEVAPVVVLPEGGSTNLSVRVTSATAPLALLEYAPGPASPAFVTLSPPVFVNTPSNGVVTASLSLHPLHDAAGVHAVTLRTVDRSGRSGSVTVAITIVDNPGLTETHWKDAANGDWFDPARWTAGVPGPGTVAVIDMPGPYSVGIHGRIEAAGVVLANASATLSSSNSEFDGAVEIRAGTLLVNSHTGVTFHQPVSNRGIIQMYSRDVNTSIGGDSFIENGGVIRSDSWGGGCCGFARASIAVHTVPAGRLLVMPGSQWYWHGGGKLTVGGTVEVGGFMGLLNEGPMPEISVMAGARLSGTGLMRLHGTSRVQLPGDVLTELHFEVLESARVEGPGVLGIEGEHTIAGTYNCPVVITRGASIHVTGWNIGSAGSLDIRPGATVEIKPHVALQFDGGVTNRGTLILYSRDVNTWLTGGGELLNDGTIVSRPWGGGCCGYTRVQVPIRTTPASRIEVEPGSQWIWESAEIAPIHGELLIRGSALAFQNGLARELTVAPDGRLVGGGFLQVDAPNRIVVEGDHELGVRLHFRSNVKVESGGSVIWFDGQELGGSYDGSFRVRANAGASSSGATFAADSSLTIHSNATFTINPNTTLTTGGSITNQGHLIMYSRDVNTGIAGSGRLENEGLLETAPWGGGCCGFARLAVPTHSVAGAQIRVVSGAQLLLEDGARLDLDGTLVVGGFLGVPGGGTSRAISLRPGSAVNGAGLMRLNGANRLTVFGEVGLSCQLELPDQSRLDGAGTLRLLGGQTLNGRIAGRVVLAGGASFAMASGLVEAGGVVEIEPGASIISNPNISYEVQGQFRNAGQLRFYSRDVNTGLFGTGSFVNSGVILVSTWGGGCCGYTRLNLAMSTTASGRLTVEPGAQLVWEAPGTPTFAGVLEINGLAALTADGAARDLTLQAGAAVTGSGLLRIDGSNRIVLGADVRIDSGLQLGEASVRAGSGTLVLGGGQVLTGIYDGSTALADDASVSVSGATIRGTLSVPASATLNVKGNQALHVSGTLTNLGTLRLFSRDVATGIDGTGRIENRGLLQVEPIGGGCCSFADLRLLVEVAPEGIIRILPGGQMRWLNGGVFRLGGTIDSNGYLGIEAEGAGRDMLLLAGSTMSGSGIVRVNGDNRLRVTGDVSVSTHLQLFGNASTAGDGLLKVQGEQSLSGTYGSPTSVEPGASVGFVGPVFLAPLSIQAGASASIAGNQTLTLRAPSTNRGTLRLHSRDVGTTLAGTGDGQLVNEGTLFSEPVGGGCCGWARIQLPVQTMPGATWRIAGGAQTLVGAGIQTVAGDLKVDGLLVFEGTDPSRDLVLNDGAGLSGGGEIRLDGANRLVVNGSIPVDVALVNLIGTTALAGNGMLAIGPTSTLRLNHSTTFPGNIELSGAFHLPNSGAEVIVGGTLTLRPTGTLNNAGTVRTPAFVDLGGTIVGNPPTTLVGPAGGGVSPMRIVDIRPSAASDGVVPSSASASTTWLLRGTGAPGTRPVVESSPDLIHWVEIPARVDETSPGNFRIRIERAPAIHQFLRLRRSN